MWANDQQVPFNVFNALQYPDEGMGSCSFVNTFESLVQEQFLVAEHTVAAESEQIEQFEAVIEVLSALAEEKFVQKSWARRFESLEVTEDTFKDNISSIEKPPVLDLKQLLDQLKYACLGEKETLPVIISSLLTDAQEDSLISALKRHKKATGWQMADIKGISPTLCMHKIPLEENAKNSVEGQRRLNPIMKWLKRKSLMA